MQSKSDSESDSEGGNACCKRLVLAWPQLGFLMPTLTGWVYQLFIVGATKSGWQLDIPCQGIFFDAEWV